METKYIFITGGVVSSLGKGIIAASLAKLLQARGLKVTIQKFDPYINIDPGTLNPYEHGECYVTDDGAETDLDLGHYERFLGVHTSKANNVTTGKIYNTVITKEREGAYLGKLPFIEAVRQLQWELPEGSCMSIHLTLVPYLSAAKELKTKPTQHSVQMLQQAGVQPDVIICRTEHPLTEELRRKVALFCNVKPGHVIQSIDAWSIYQVPLNMHAEHLDELVVRKLGIENFNQPDLRLLEEFLDRLKHPETQVDVALVGKYVSLQDAYKSILEALVHAGAANSCKVHVHSINSEEITAVNVAEKLKGMKGVLVAPGFGSRGLEGKVEAIRYARENRIPFLGICLGMQMCVVEFARNVLGFKDAESTEVNPDTTHPVIDMMEDQKKTTMKGGTMRLGAYDCQISKDTLAYKIYGKTLISERHRHRYEFNAKYAEDFKKAGLVASGHNPQTGLTEIVELPQSVHPFFIGSQFHPEYKSTPETPHPLFKAFIAACNSTACR